MAITANKFLGKKKGGALAVRPKTNIVPVKGKGSSIEKVESENPTLVIRTKLIKIEDILKGTLAAEKKAADERKKAKEQEERAEEEKDIEADPKSETKFKLPLPGKIKSWWENIKQFFFKVLFGWLFLKFMKWLPKLKGILKLLAGIAEFVLDWGGKILNGLVTFVSWGMDAYDWTKDKIEDVFGEEGAKTFEKIAGVMKNVLNLTIGLTLAMIAFSNEFGSSLVDWGKGFMSIFKHGLKRAVPRLLIKMFGKKTAASLLGKSVVAKTAAATTATTAGGTTVGTTATGVVGMLKKMGQKAEDDWFQRYQEKKWLDPRKAVDWGILQIMKALNFGMGTLGTLLDIIGAPFRYLVELIRYPFLDEAGKAKQRQNLGKFDARIREQFRETVNAFSLGLLAKDKGAFGSLYGKEGTDAMGYTKDGKTKSEQLKEFASYENGSSEEIVIIRRPMGRSAAKNRSEDEKDVISVDTGTGFNVSFNSSSLYR